MGYTAGKTHFCNGVLDQKLNNMLRQVTVYGLTLGGWVVNTEKVNLDTFA